MASQFSDLEQQLIHSLILLADVVSTTSDMAKYDQLTGLLSRAHFERLFAGVIQVHQASHQAFAVLMIDLNSFKEINDRFGHYVGDQLLKTFSRKIINCVGEEHVVARLGGDEFVIILKNTAIDRARQKAEEIVAWSKEPYTLSGFKMHCSASIGMVCYPCSGSSYERLMRRADFALYQAKVSQGVRTYTKALEVDFKKRKQLEDSVRVAVDQQLFMLEYQPQVNLVTGRIVGFEGLVRWQDDRDVMQYPSNLIPVIERMGFAEQLNQYVVKEAIHVSSQLPEGVSLSINISPVVYNIEEHMNTLLDLVQDAGLDRVNHPLEFELTESSFMEGEGHFHEGFQRVIERLRGMKMRLAIDDFGVKYSSITRLLDFHFDVLKIDQAFVQKLDQADGVAAKAVIEAILHVANHTNLQVVAEGVETQAQNDILKSLGCNMAQGYYFHRPMSFDQVLWILSGQAKEGE